jgi:type I restriction enzyme S subunit
MKEGWELKRLGDILKIQNGYAFDAKLFSVEVGMPLIRIRDIKYGIGTVTNYTGDYDQKYEVHAGDFLIGMDGEFGCYEWKGRRALLNQRVCRLQEYSKDLFPRFLFYSINKDLKAIEDVTAFATVKHISSKQIENICIHLPPLLEQQRIVSIIDKAFEAIDKAIENTQKNLHNAKDLFESHLNSVFENDDEGWERKKLGDIASVQYGYTDKSFDEGQFRYIRITDISPDGTLIAEDKKYLSDLNKLDLQDYILEHHDLLMARTGATFAKVLLYENLEPSVFASYLIKIKFKVHIENELYWYFTKTKMYWLQAHHLSSGSAQPQFNGAALKQLEVSYPTDIVKQKELIKEFKELLLKVTELESQYQQKLRDLEELKKSILNKAFAGEL